MKDRDLGRLVIIVRTAEIHTCNACGEVEGQKEGANKVARFLCSNRARRNANMQRPTGHVNAQRQAASL
jgi:hypothetical protein